MTSAFPESQTGRLRVTLFEACSAFTHVTACMLAKSPMRPSTPKASVTSLPPSPLRLLPAGATDTGWVSHPLEIRAFSRRTEKLRLRWRVGHSRTEDLKRLSLDVIGEVRSGDGSTVLRGFREELDVPLSDLTAKALPRRQVVYDTGFTLFPGKYTVKFLVHDEITGRIGTLQTAFEVPNLMKGEQNVPTSSLILSNELVNMEDALPNALQPRSFSAAGQAVLDPLVISGRKLIPSVTHVISKSRDLLVYLHAYEPDATATRPLTAFVSLYLGDTKALETAPLTVADGLDQESKSPLKLTVPLTSLSVGPYECVVTILDPVTQKVTVLRSPIILVD